MFSTMPYFHHSTRIRTSFAVLASVALSLGACAVATAPPGDEVDAASGIDASDPPANIDAASPPVDAPAPPVDAPAGPPTCDTLYGGATQYALCEEAPDSCRFSAWTNGGNCNTLCSAFGGTCIAAFDNNAGAPCVATAQQTCATNADDEICVCSRQ